MKLLKQKEINKFKIKTSNCCLIDVLFLTFVYIKIVKSLMCGSGHVRSIDQKGHHFDGLNIKNKKLFVFL